MIKKVICYVIGAAASLFGVLPGVYYIANNPSTDHLIGTGAFFTVALFFFACAFEDSLAKKVSLYCAGGLSVLYAIMGTLAVLASQNMVLGLVVLFYAGLAVPSFIFGNDTRVF